MSDRTLFSVLAVEGIADFLEGLGHQVGVETSGVTGLHLIVTQPHDVIGHDLDQVQATVI